MELVFYREGEVLTREVIDGKDMSVAGILLDFLGLDIKDWQAVLDFGSRWGVDALFSLMPKDIGVNEFCLRKLSLGSASVVAAPADITNLEREQGMLRDAFFSWVYRGGEYFNEELNLKCFGDGSGGIIPKMQPHIPLGHFLKKGKDNEILGPLGIGNKVQQVEGGESEKPYQRIGVFPLPPVWITEQTILSRTAQVSFCPVFEFKPRPKFEDIEEYNQYLRKQLLNQKRPVWKVVSADIIALAWVELFACVEWGLAGKVKKCEMCGRFFIHPGRRSKKYCPVCEETAPKERYKERRQEQHPPELLKQCHALYRQMDRGKITLNEYNAWRLEHGFAEYEPRRKSKISKRLQGK